MNTPSQPVSQNVIWQSFTLWQGWSHCKYLQQGFLQPKLLKRNKGGRGFSTLVKLCAGLFFYEGWMLTREEVCSSGWWTVKYRASPNQPLNRPTSHSTLRAGSPTMDNSDLIIAFIHPPRPVIAKSDDSANNYDILLTHLQLYWSDL